MITHTWKINNIKQLDDKTGTVTNISFQLLSTNGNSHFISRGEVELNTNNIENFINYENLTQEIVLDWIKTNLGEKYLEYEMNHTELINSTTNLHNPKIVTKSLPWNNI